MPEFSPRLPPLVEIRRLESAALVDKAATLGAVLDAFVPE